jgi:hypothetical protein
MRTDSAITSVMLARREVRFLYRLPHGPCMRYFPPYVMSAHLPALAPQLAGAKAISGGGGFIACRDAT